MLRRPLTPLLVATALAALAGLAAELRLHGHVHLFGEDSLHHHHFFVADHDHPEQTPQAPDDADPDRDAVTIACSTPSLAASDAGALPGIGAAPEPVLQLPAAAVTVAVAYDPASPRAPPA